MKLKLTKETLRTLAATLDCTGYTDGSTNQPSNWTCTTGGCPGSQPSDCRGCD